MFFGPEQARTNPSQNAKASKAAMLAALQIAAKEAAA
jgi:hypothetical protein